MNSVESQPILTVAQMRAAEQALFDGGTSVDVLMQIAGHGAGEWVWRLSGGRAVTVLCGPGNNGGDGWVLAELIRERGGDVAVIAPREPATEAARHARAGYRGVVLDPDDWRTGEVFVDCLFGSGLTRPLGDADIALLARLGAAHHTTVAVDLPSGIDSDAGVALSSGLPRIDLTVALGAWKFAHWTMPAAAMMGERRLVEIGIGTVEGAAHLLAKPRIPRPPSDAHKYTRGLLAVIGGAMPGAARLAARAAMHGGAGYVKLLGKRGATPPAEPVIDNRPLAEALDDLRISALLIGPGLGRDETARERLAAALGVPRPLVLDADALHLIRPDDLATRTAPTVLTPHEGEMAVLKASFGLEGKGHRRDRALALARASGAVVLLKGSDSLIASPAGKLVCAPPAPSWLSVAGTGDVLAGVLVSRLATGVPPLEAACEALWLHGEAARQARPAFTAGQLADAVQGAVGAALA